MATVVLIVHHRREGAADLGARLARWLLADGHEVRLTPNDAEGIGVPELAVPDELGEGADLAVSLGGDGNMLRTVARVADHGVPVLGVNFGKLGYLTSVEPSGAREAITGFFEGAHLIEERMRIEAVVERTGERVAALNEVVAEKVETGRTIGVAVAIDGEFFTTYAADGLIVATPTGSTAYSLSARGPIVEPTHEALVLTPVSPHMLFDRSLVLDPTSTVRLEILADRPAALAVDGMQGPALLPGDAVVCGASAVPARLVMVGGIDFHRVLKTKFGLNDR